MIEYFGEKDIRARMSMSDCIDAVRTGFISLGKGEVVAADRTIVPYENENTFLSMSVYYPKIKRIVSKLVTVVPGNLIHHRPLINAVIIVQDATTGEQEALLDGSVITQMRTAAGSGVATDFLARKNSKVLAVFGTGKQAESHLEAMIAVRPIEEVMVFGRTPEKSKAFKARMSGIFNQLQFSTPDLDQLGHADIICTCTTSSAPIFGSKHVLPGTHINAVGVFELDKREIPEETVLQSTVIIDYEAGCRKEAGDIMIPVNAGRLNFDSIRGELGSLLMSGRPYERRNDEITIFKSVGHGIQDAAAVGKVMGLL